MALEAAGATPGVDFRAQFEVPVFKTAESREDVTEKSSLNPDARAERLEEAARTSSIHLRDLGDGRLEMDVPPAVFRSLGGFLSLALFTVIWTIITFVIAWTDAPIFFPLVFGLFGLFMWLAVLQLLTGRKQTRITPDTVEASSRFLCFWSRKTIPASSVRRVGTPITARTQSGSKRTVYHNVRVFYEGEQKERHVDVASSIASKDEAQWIAEMVENALLGG